MRLLSIRHVHLLGSFSLCLLLSGLLTDMACAQETISVRDFGAVGDGQNDDAQAIQTAIQMALEKQVDVLFPAGVYLVRSTLTVPPGVGLRGRGNNSYWNAPLAGSTIRRDGKLAEATMICQGQNRITGLCFDGGDSQQTAIQFVDVEEHGRGRYCTISMCTFWRHSIGLDGNYKSHETWIENCRFHQMGIGILNFPDSRVHNCTFSNCRTASISLATGDTNITFCTIEFGGGIVLTDDHDNQISDIRFDRTWGPSILATKSKNLLIGSCSFQRSGADVKNNPLRNSHIALLECDGVTIVPGRTKADRSDDLPDVTPLHSITLRHSRNVEITGSAWLSGCTGQPVLEE
ncbi:right-handed parallel beta-helix repeat-containing protein [Planctomicrobium piriforme]|uniref:Pectate lyase superfamily protein n=1 Tax=Planctomicrobium piriforme TaxID=1576369 RepID=A0A1I3EJN4_9PLAN|nr:right-handed parallel beta-helix repeat-containing protein [Planctomicrobium piriforme]SFH99194.1 Pectate lyase superfamily protein [Planctomicrobium piriforme]